MNASMLAALASPGGPRTPVVRAEAAGFSTDESNQARGTTAAARVGADKENSSTSVSKSKRVGAGSHAPSFTVPDPPSTPWRMENLRVLIEEGKMAAAEGRLVAALRKYETAMVTIPEAYKPRLRNKIARLEARLDAEEARSPGTPGRVSLKACREAAQNLGTKDPGPLDLLQVAALDVAAAAATEGTGGGGGGRGAPLSDRRIPAGAFSTSPSPRRSSPLVREIHGFACGIPTVSEVVGKGSPPLPDQDASLAVTRLGEKLAASNLTAPPTSPVASGGSTPSRRAPLPARRQSSKKGGKDGGGECGRTSPRACPTVESGDDYCGLGGAEEGAGSDEDVEEVGTQERLRTMNKGLSAKLEKQIVGIINKASSAELMELHGIGQQRAQLILKKRAEAPFETLADLKRINMYEKEIWTLGRRNMLECLDVCRPVEVEDGDATNSSEGIHKRRSDNANDP